jgi:hypothetical protein
MMNQQRLVKLIERLRRGEINTEQALQEFKILPFEDIDFAKIDHHRELRNGFGEVVFCQGKTPQQVAEIICRLSNFHDTVLATRANEEAFCATRELVPDACYYPEARIILVDRQPREQQQKFGRVLVVSAGTADLPVCEEAAISAEVMGCEVKRLYDVGVAGIHRLFYQWELLEWADVIIVVAGMEGALASIIGGLVSQPVIAVPTSVGYGAHLNGLSSLLSMLNSCAMGVGVVNIDNGFGAAALASAIVKTRWRERHEDCLL